MPIKVTMRDRDPQAVLAYMRENFEVDPERGTILWKRVDLCGRRAGTPARGKGGNAYHLVKFKGQQFVRSWLIYLWVNGRWPPHHLDHIDGDSLNDAISNLREATAFQNAWNHRRKECGLKQPMGVVRQGKTFAAHIMKNGTRRWYRGHATPEEAHLTYLEKRKEFFGEFA